jgi:hypothetical protein
VFTTHYEYSNHFGHLRINSHHATSLTSTCPTPNLNLNSPTSPQATTPPASNGTTSSTNPGCRGLKTKSSASSGRTRRVTRPKVFSSSVFAHFSQHVHSFNRLFVMHVVHPTPVPTPIPIPALVLVLIRARLASLRLENARTHAHANTAKTQANSTKPKSPATRTSMPSRTALTKVWQDSLRRVVSSREWAT